MKLFLIRHGETVDNVAGKYAGTTDSCLTNHGVLQADRLGQHLATSNLFTSHIFSSDLQRAFKTAEAVRLAQSRHTEALNSPALEMIRTILLREQDYGYYEGKRFHERSKDKDSKNANKTGEGLHLEAHRNEPGFADIESKESMNRRCDRFLDEHLLPVLKSDLKESTVIVVAHGVILSHLWRCFLKRFPAKSVNIAPGDMPADKDITLEHLGGWSNTGFLELELEEKKENKQGRAEPAESLILPTEALKQAVPKVPTDKTIATPDQSITSLPVGMSPTIKPNVSPTSMSQLLNLANVTVLIKGINKTDHLLGLKKTRGGIGSLKHDDSQKTIESFFKKRKLG